jgi:hypothetical protein
MPRPRVLTAGAAPRAFPEGVARSVNVASGGIGEPGERLDCLVPSMTRMLPSYYAEQRVIRSYGHRI